MSNNILEVKDLNIFTQSKHIVKNISFEVEKGQIVCLIGQSGSGKTVTALSIAKLLPPNLKVNANAIKLDNTNLINANNKTMQKVRGKEVGFIFQDPFSTFNPIKTIKSQLKEAILIHYPHKTKKALAKDIKSALKIAGILDIENFIHKYPHQFSGGQLQRLAIAMAIINKPKLIIADEPTTSLDPLLQKNILLLIKEICTKMKLSSLFITHNINVAQLISNKTFVMFDGKIVEKGDTETIYNNPKHPYTKELIKSHSINVVKNPVLGNTSILNIINLSNFYIRKEPLFKKPELDLVLKDINLNMYQGENIGIIGASGSGKSTILKCIMQLIEYLGDIVINNVNPQNLSSGELRKFRKNFQMVSQNPISSLNPRLNIAKTLNLPIHIHFPELTKKEVEAKINNLIKISGFTKQVLERYPHQLSGGEKQKISILRAFSTNPKLIILDEPTSALDLKSRNQIVELLLKKQKDEQLSYIIISHDMEVIKALTNRVLVLKKGIIVEQANTEEIIKNPRLQYTKKLLSNYI